MKYTTYAFIDATNIIYGCTYAGWKMDFKKLAHYLRDRYSVERMLYYAGVDYDNKKQLDFYQILKSLGFTLRLIPVKRFQDGSKKADVDSLLTFEIMKYYSDYDEAILMTGDGDYYWVLEYLLTNHKKVRLLSFTKRTARELKQLMREHFSDLGRLEDMLSLSDKKIR